jgi:hypothetical protein
MKSYFVIVATKTRHTGVIAVDMRLPHNRAKGLIEQTKNGISGISNLLMPVSDFVGHENEPLVVREIVCVEEHTQEGVSSGMSLVRDSGERCPCIVSREKKFLGEYIYTIYGEKGSHCEMLTRVA